MADPIIESYHAHVYYDAETRPRAEALREAIAARFSVELGRWHDEPIGPHPCASYQVAFKPPVFAELVPWLALHRDGLVIFLHPNSGDDVADHRDYALWMGAKLELDLEALT